MNFGDNLNPGRYVVLTVSDTRNEADDRSGATLVERIESAGHMVATKVMVPRA